MPPKAGRWKCLHRGIKDTRSSSLLFVRKFRAKPVIISLFLSQKMFDFFLIGVIISQRGVNLADREVGDFASDCFGVVAQLIPARDALDCYSVPAMRGLPALI